MKFRGKLHYIVKIFYPGEKRRTLWPDNDIEVVHRLSIHVVPEVDAAARAGDSIEGWAH